MISRPPKRLSWVHEPMYSLQLQNRVEDLEALSAWVAACGESLGLGPRSQFGLELVLTEIVTNIIDHAYADDQNHNLFLELSARDNRIEVSVVDDGRPFNPLEQEEAQLPTRLEEASVGGLGLHLVRRYADACHYRREQERNILTVLLINETAPG
jgi:anti-sigma regulatory factor (Ser/Thr protein kinase)